MQISGTGSVVGALVGAVARGAVVCFWLGGVAGIVALPSAGIGLLVGAIAGATGKPLRGAVVGAVLSGIVFELFLCACASVLGDVRKLFGQNGNEADFLRAALPFTLSMGLAGALAGGIGGAAGGANSGNHPSGGLPEKPDRII